MGQFHFDPAGSLLLLLALIITATVHEFAHAYAADRMGDPTPREQERVSLIPLDQFDLFRAIAAVVFAVFGFGYAWGKPVPVKAENLAGDPRRSDRIVTVCGPAANLLLAIAAAIIMRTGYFHLGALSAGGRLINAFFEVNVVTLLFNFVPLPPFDGARFLIDSLTEQGEKAYQEFLAHWGWVLLFAALFFGSYATLFAVVKLERLIVPPAPAHHPRSAAPVPAVAPGARIQASSKIAV